MLHVFNLINGVSVMPNHERSTAVTTSTLKSTDDPKPLVPIDLTSKLKIMIILKSQVIIFFFFNKMFQV